MSRFLSPSFFLKAVLFVLFALGAFHPIQNVVHDIHDAGSQATYEYWTTHHAPFGVEVVQNVGPLGFINYPDMYTGFLGYAKMGLYVAVAIAFAALTLRTAWLLPIRARLVFLVFVWLLVENEPQLYLLSLLAGYALYFPTSVALILAVIPVLVVLALAKGSLLFIALFIIGISTVRHLLLRKWGHAALLSFGFAAAFAGIWWMLGQPVANIFRYIQAEMYFSTGYNEAQSAFESHFMTFLGFSSLGIAAFGIVRHRLSHWRSRPAIDVIDGAGIALLEGFVMFAAWKHGFVRADGHVINHFLFLVGAATLYFWLPSPQEETISPKERSLRWKLLAAVLVLCVGGYEKNYFPIFSDIFTHKWGRASTNPDILLDLPGYFKDLDTRLAESIKTFDMPKVNAVAAGQDVGYFGMLPGMMVYNRFTYRCMPSAIPFQAWNPWIMGRDAAFFHNDATAPHYVLYNLQSPDNRLPPLDDATAQLELLQHYDVKLAEKENLLLERRGHAPDISITPEIPEKKYVLEEWADVPRMDGPIWMRINIPYTVIGKMLSILYKPADYEMEYVLANGRTYTQKIIPVIARVGFMAAPLITNNPEFLAANNEGELAHYRAGPSGSLSRIVKFRMHCVHMKLGCSKKYSVAFDSIHGLELGHMPTNTWSDLLGQLYGFHLKLLEMTSTSVVKRDDDVRPLLQCHAPCLVRVEKAGMEKAKLSGVYGMFASTYGSTHKSCHTNGVHMIVSAALNGKAPVKLLERTLTPVETTGDRGIQPLDLAIPPGTGEITVNVDDNGDPSCDQFFIDDLALR